jgi:hypothetical protein
MEAGSLDKRKIIIGLSLLLLTTAGITAFLMAFFFQKEQQVGFAKKDEIILLPAYSPDYQSVFRENELLTNRLQAIHNLDKKFADQLTKPGRKKQLDTIRQEMYIQEGLFRKLIDSIFLNPSSAADSSLHKFSRSLLASYQSILDNRRSISSLRIAANLDNGDLSPGELSTLSVQNQLQDKNVLIADLENKLRIMEAETKPAAVVKGDSNKDDIYGFQENTTVQQTKINELISANANLKQQNDLLLKQQKDADKNVRANETQLKSKAISLQQKVNALSAELELAQVDCNISRADAAQIISNSKQRKQLLNEASGILTSLVNSDDADIRKRAQDKIVRLNRVAANSRD